MGRKFRSKHSLIILGREVLEEVEEVFSEAQREARRWEEGHSGRRDFMGLCEEKKTIKGGWGRKPFLGGDRRMKE